MPGLILRGRVSFFEVMLLQQRFSSVLIVALSLALLIPVALAGWKAYSRATPARTAEAYISALVRGDPKDALQVSSGSAALAAKKAVNSGAQISDIQISVPTMGRNWCEALAFVEIVLQDKSHDAGFYSVELFRDKEWKVISVRQASPWVSGLWGVASKKDVKDAEDVLNSYLRMLSKNQYQSAARMLCGQARLSHEKGAAALGKAPLFKSVGDVHLVPLWKRGNQMVCRAGYEIDGRGVNAIVRFIRLQDGWHILQISSY